MADTTSLNAIPEDFCEGFMPYKSTLRQRIQARKYANESYIKTVKLYKCNEGNVLVKSVVYRSQRRNDDGHRIDLSVGKDRIIDAHCSCKAGVAGECAHVLAVVLKLTDWVLEGLIEVPSQPACTSMPQQWDKPRGERIESEPVSCMVISKPGNSNRKKRPLTSDFFDNRKIQLLENDISHLQSLGATLIAYLASWPESLVATDHGLQPVGSTSAHQLPLLQPVGPTDGGFPCTNMKFPTTTVTLNVPNINNSEKLENVSLSKEDAQKLDWNTRDQNDNQLWLDEQKKRITASNFGRFMLRKAQVTQKFVSSVVNPKKFTSAATSYGSSNEKVAKNMYRKKTKNHLHECGLIVNPAYPYIGATPDGKICERSGQTGILEVKCPFSIRDMTVKDAVNDEGIRAKLCVKRDGENIALKHNHAYWYQVQGQLLVTGAEFCDFVTYTRQDSDLHIQRILPDADTMQAILDKMANLFEQFVFE